MIRIRTRIGDARVFTILFQGKWVTIMSGVGKSQSTDADNLIDAGNNHLTYCRKLKEIMDERGRLAAKLLHGEGHSGNVNDGVSISNDGTHREGTDGNGRSERHESLSTDSPSTKDQDPSQLGSQDAELDDG